MPRGFAYFVGVASKRRKNVPVEAWSDSWWRFLNDEELAELAEYVRKSEPLFMETPEVLH